MTANVKDMTLLTILQEIYLLYIIHIHTRSSKKVVERLDGQLACFPP